MLTIEELNSASKEEFNKTIDLLFESSTKLQDLLFSAKPYENYTQLINSIGNLCLQNNSLSRQDLVNIINAHPRLGETKENLSKASFIEQGYNKVSTDDEEVNEQLRIYNEKYSDKFGFNFVVFVNGRPRKDLIQVIKQRYETGTVESEIKTAVNDMMSIAFDRLKKQVKN